MNSTQNIDRLIGQAVEQLSDIFLIIDENFEICYANKKFVKYFGENRKSIAQFFSKKNELSAIKQNLQNHKTWVGEINLKNLDNENRSFDFSIDCLDNKKSVWVGFDSQNRKKNELELIRAKEKAEEVAHAKELFLSTMSHEIRTPMNAIIGLIHVLQQDNPKPEQLENLKILRFSAENLLSLLNDILDFSKIEAGKINFESIDFYIKDLLRGIKKSFEYAAKEKGIQLKLILDDELPEILIGDATRLAQVLNNLVNNAIKFTEKGEVVIKVILEKNMPNAHLIRFEVMDTGIGIEAAKIESIFSPFSQANADTARRYGGTGLGLSISKNLLSLQNSQIFVESEPNKGSNFYFSLIFEKSSQKNDAPHKNNFSLYENLAHYQAKLLMVEDNQINQLVATKFLTHWGIFPDYAIDGTYALEKIKQKQYDLILMDLQMPQMDGYQTTQIIRKYNEYYSQVPIIALTASANIRDKAFEYGMNDYVIKPFNPTELYTKIVKYIKLLPTKKPIFEDNKPIHLQNVREMSYGDKDFEQQILLLYKENLLELHDSYEQILAENDLKKLRFLVHRIKPALDILQLDFLVNALEEGKSLLAQEMLKEEDLLASLHKVQSYCKKTVAELENCLL